MCSPRVINPYFIDGLMTEIEGHVSDFSQRESCCLGRHWLLGLYVGSLEDAGRSSADGSCLQRLDLPRQLLSLAMHVNQAFPLYPEDPLDPVGPRY